MSGQQQQSDMQDFLITTGIILLICSPTVAVIAFGIYKGAYTLADKPPTYPDERELERREYETMLRHRRRAKLEKQFNTSPRP